MNPNEDPRETNNGSAAEMQAEIRRLSEALRECQQELERQRQVLADVTAERDEYRKILHAPLKAKFTEEELRRFAEDVNLEDAKELHEFIDEIEDILNGKQRP